MVAGPSGTTHRYVCNKGANDCPNVFAVTRKYCSIAKYLVPNTSSFVCCPLRVNEDQSETTWMLDSGASCHFTNDLNDFVEFEENVGPKRVVRTANGSTSIIGKGTVIFTVNGEWVRLYPIFYIPDLNDHLLLLRQFHRSGLSSRGDAHAIVLYDGNDEEFTGVLMIVITNPWSFSTHICVLTPWSLFFAGWPRVTTNGPWALWFV